jgi:dipeptide/tripeptide permease
MFLITILFYKEPERNSVESTLGDKFRDMWVALSDIKFTIFLILLGIFFWLPFWAFFNLLAVYIDRNLDTITLYNFLKDTFGPGFAGIFSHQDDQGNWKLLGETISHTGYIIMIFQIGVSRVFEKRPPLISFNIGLAILAAGFMIIGYSIIASAAIVFFGIFLVAIGEMISSPRIQEYITWIAPKEKAGLYMGSNFLAIGLGGGLSGLYTTLYGAFRNSGHPEYVWYTLAAHMVLGIIAIMIFTRSAGEFKELEE